MKGKNRSTYATSKMKQLQIMMQISVTEITKIFSYIQLGSHKS